MPTFLNFPNEILLNIIENLQCENIESVTLLCKHIRELALKILNQHLSRKHRFTTIAIGQTKNLTWDENAQIRGVHPIVALRDFLLDEESALYPRTLIVGRFDHNIDPEEGQIADSDLANIVAQLEDRLSSKVLEVTRVLHLDNGPTKIRNPNWTSSIVSGDLEAAAYLLITLLPNLKKLRIVDRYRYCFYWTLRRLITGAINSKCDLKGLNSLKRLSEVGFHSSDNKSGEDILLDIEFSALSSIRTIKGRNVNGEDKLPGYFYKTPSFDHTLRPNSDITSLEFH